MPNVSAVYPGQVINYGSDVINFTTTVLAEHINYLRAEVTSVETTLGTYITTSSGWTGSFTRPAISYTWNTLKDRLNNIEYGLNTTWNAKVPTGGSTGQVLQKNSGTDYDFSWVTFSGLPPQSTHNGQFLTTDGTNASWAAVSSYSAPTLGSTTISSGATVSTITGLTENNLTLTGTLTANSGTGTNGQFLQTTGTGVKWAAIPSGETFNPLMLAGM